MDITVAICTWNRASLLRETLARLEEVSAAIAPSWSLLVIDNNSTDETQAVINSFTGRLPITNLIERRQGQCHARNLAIREARGTHLVFIDDDVLVDGQWLNNFARGAEAFPDAAAFGGPIDPWFKEPPDPVVAEAFPLLATGFCGILDDRPEGVLPEGQEVFGANMAFRLAALGDLEFDPNLGPSATPGLVGDEIDFVARLRRRGGRVVWLPDMRVRHYVAPFRMTVPYLCDYYEGRGRTFIRSEGVPKGRAIFGVPIWLLRQWAGRVVVAARDRAFAGRRAYLVSRRWERYERGMVKECASARHAHPLRHS
jgi:glycosyltransferase involved in cell wall biosynthesis